ncbi:hypothetical protein As57867_010991, partial [Aphanomyces stellatus]
MQTRSGSSLLAHVLHLPGSDSITLQFHLHGLDRQLVRQVDEELSRVLVRMDRLVNPLVKKRDQKLTAKQQPKATPKAVLKAAAVIQFKTRDGDALSPTSRVIDAFLAASFLEINSNVYRILHNQPRVKAVSLAVDTHFCGVPILPTVDLDFCTPAECTWVWRRGDDATAVVVGTDRMYTPTAADAGHALTVTCTPPRSADASDDDDVIAVTTTTEPVRAGPDR